MQTQISAASRLVETARREPFGILFTLLTISSPRPGADHSREQIGQRLPRAFHARRHDAGGDHGGFQQAQIILREIEDFREVRDVGGCAEIHAGQPQHRLIDHAQIGFDRRRGAVSRPCTPRSIETFSTRAPSGKSIPRKKMSLQPLCVRSMRTGVRSRRIG